jgi:carbonic anhydrase/acetyltransferase-like protein (isoleucine patch superfamily)
MSLRTYNNKSPKLGQDVYIDEAATVIGEVSIADDSSIWPQAVVRGDVNRITIGARSNIQDQCVLHVTHDSERQPGGFGLQIGDEVTIGHGVILHGCEISDGCMIGMGSMVMDGATLEDEVMLAAGSLVTPGKQLDGRYLWVGRPARKQRALTADELDYLRYSAAHYVRLKNSYL